MKVDIRNQDGRYIVSVRGVDLRGFKTLKSAAIYADDSAQEDFEDKYLPPKRFWKVRCVETGEEFESLTSAARAVGASLSSIWIAVNKSTRCRGMHFEYMT